MLLLARNLVLLICFSCFVAYRHVCVLLDHHSECSVDQTDLARSPDVPSFAEIATLVLHLR